MATRGSPPLLREHLLANPSCSLMSVAAGGSIWHSGLLESILLWSASIQTLKRLNGCASQKLPIASLFVDAFADGGSDNELIIEGNPWQRLSVARTLEIRQPSLAEYLSSQRTTNNPWTETRLAERSVQLPDCLKSLSVTDINFIKIDLDGADFAILQSCAGMLHES